MPRTGARDPEGAGRGAGSLAEVEQSPTDGSLWRRGSDPEFNRPLNFTDAVFAIALTLLALDLRIDTIPGDPDSVTAMWQALNDLVPQVTAYIVAFVLLGKYWLAHHRFAARLAGIDSRFLALTLVYLAFIAVLPFPTSLIGSHEGNPLSGVLFALNLAAISGMETVLLLHAQHRELLLDGASPAMRRWELISSLAPAAMFTATIPLAFIDPTWMLLSWLVVGLALGRWGQHARPPD